MKYIITAFSFAIVSLSLLCKQPKGEKTITSNQHNSISATTTEVGKIDNINLDSIRLDSFFREAVRIAASKQDSCFSDIYVETMPDSSYQIEVRLSSDFYFTKEHPHIIIKRLSPALTNINIFLKTDKGLQPLISYEQPTDVYSEDTILDINGDRLKDFVVNSHASSGCCLNAFSDVYLLKPDKQSFSNSFYFINPTFSPEERMIRGVCYGHAGETEMYKYKWNGEAVDTVEYIYYEENEKHQKTGKLIAATDVPYGDNPKILRRLNAVPAEYKKIDGYNWFTGKGKGY